MKKVYVAEISNEIAIACESICGALDYLLDEQMIDFNEESEAYIYQANNTDYAIKEMSSTNWKNNIYNLIEDKIYKEIEECCVGESYSGKIVIKEIDLI